MSKVHKEYDIILNFLTKAIDRRITGELKSVSGFVSEVLKEWNLLTPGEKEHYAHQVKDPATSQIKSKE